MSGCPARICRRARACLSKRKYSPWELTCPCADKLVNDPDVLTFETVHNLAFPDLNLIDKVVQKVTGEIIEISVLPHQPHPQRYISPFHGALLFRCFQQSMLQSLTSRLIGDAEASKTDRAREQRMLRQRIHKLDSITEKLYEDRVIGVLSEETYSKLAHNTEAERLENEKRLSVLLVQFRVDNFNPLRKLALLPCVLLIHPGKPFVRKLSRDVILIAF